MWVGVGIGCGWDWNRKRKFAREGERVGRIALWGSQYRFSRGRLRSYNSAVCLEVGNGLELGSTWDSCVYCCFGIKCWRCACGVGREKENEKYTEANYSHRAYAGKVEKRGRAMCISSAR